MLVKHITSTALAEDQRLQIEGESHHGPVNRGRSPKSKTNRIQLIFSHNNEFSGRETAEVTEQMTALLAGE